MSLVTVVLECDNFQHHCMHEHVLSPWWLVKKSVQQRTSFHKQYCYYLFICVSRDRRLCACGCGCSKHACMWWLVNFVAMFYDVCSTENMKFYDELLVLIVLSPAWQFGFT